MFVLGNITTPSQTTVGQADKESWNESKHPAGIHPQISGEVTIIISTGYSFAYGIN